MPRFSDPLISARARRSILAQCQQIWDRSVAEAIGYSGHVNHLTVVENEISHEFIVLRDGRNIPYPKELEECLQTARLWARKKVDTPPQLSGLLANLKPI